MNITKTAIHNWNINFVNGFTPLTSSFTPKTINVVEPNPKIKAVFDTIKSWKKIEKRRMGMPADKKTATPPKIGTCKECDFLAEGVSVKFLAVASL